MTHFLQNIGVILGILFFVCYGYQMIYAALSLFCKIAPPKGEPKPNRFAVLICARNEAAVLPELLRSIRAQTYPHERITAFVMADNCTDDTAAVARAEGAVVYVRQNRESVGKGYALEALLGHIAEDYPADAFDGFFVFDADNVLDEAYIEEMNKTFSEGYDIVTSYRNTKNYGDNWISAGYGLWFLHEARHLNHGRMLMKSSCAVSGTGFLFSRAKRMRIGGWPYHLLTEDIEFTYGCVTKGERIGYCPRAVCFDEQPTEFRQSWKQRMRWAKGYYQVLRKYGRSAFGAFLRGSLSCYDMLMSIIPMMIISCVGLLANGLALAVALFGGAPLAEILRSVWDLLWALYGAVFVIGALTVLTEWKQIYASTRRKLISVLTFPLFMFTYLPISIVALFRPVRWEPIRHDRAVSLAQVRKSTPK